MPCDPVSQPKGTNAYYAAYRSIVYSFIASWGREDERVKKVNDAKSISLWNYLTQHRMVHYNMLHLTILLATYHYLGMSSVKFHFAYLILSSFLIEQINYVEHYGLRREKDENGIYESITLMDAWNTTSSVYATRIQRHSDHHAHVYRPYFILRRFDKAPYLPYEYIQMIMISICPPIFFMIMDPRVQAIEDAKKGIKNPDQWNNEQEPSDADKKRLMIADTYLFMIFCLLTVVTFI